MLEGGGRARAPPYKSDGRAKAQEEMLIIIPAGHGNPIEIGYGVPPISLKKESDDRKQC